MDEVRIRLICGGLKEGQLLFPLFKELNRALHSFIERAESPRSHVVIKKRFLFRA